MSVILARGRLALLAVVAALAMALSVGSAAAQTVSFAFTGAKVSWSPPVDGTYRVTATGASGGGSLNNRGGYAAVVAGTFTLSAGTSYQIAVGKAGEGGNNSARGGGGGGTFFVTADDMPLLVAAGGGGASYTPYQAGGDADPTFATSGPGLGGGQLIDLAAGGGAGFYGDGSSSQYSHGGKSWSNGLAGGSGSGGSLGGFGGGGEGGTMSYTGGGGGGYSGGAGGYSSGGGAGTSFDLGQDPQASTATAFGDGSLTIELIAAADTSDAAEASIGNFLATRNQLLLSSGPDIQQFINRFSGGSAPGTVTLMGYSASTGLPLDVQLGPDVARFRYSSAYQDTGAGSALEEGQLLGYSPALGAVDAVAPSEPIQKLAFWAQGAFARTSDDALFGVVHVGGDYLFTDSVLVGISAEIDRMTQGGDTTLSGTGYSVGPYVTVKLSDSLFFDARIAGGQSFNQITQPGAPADSFTGTRWLGSTSLTGQFDIGVVRIAPTAKVAVMTETTEAYIDHNGYDVAAVTATTGTVELGPRLSLIPDTMSGFTPYLSATGVWTFVDTTAQDDNSVRARLEGGAAFGSAGGLSASASAFYDGLGTDWQAWGASLGLNAPLQ